MRIALFGGTFDPVHNAHLIIARQAAEHFHLDQVLLIPSANPPHKPAGSTTPYHHRFEMVRLACQGNPRLIASTMEEGTERSYSINTIEKAKQTFSASTEILFLIGADAFAEIGTWYRAADVIRAVEFIVVSRPGYMYPVPAGARVHRLESVALPVSSSEIRFRLESGDLPQDLPAPVLDYIRENGLYGSGE